MECEGYRLFFFDVFEEAFAGLEPGPLQVLPLPEFSALIQAQNVMHLLVCSKIVIAQNRETNHWSNKKFKNKNNNLDKVLSCL